MDAPSKPTPFTILVDSAEQNPFLFENIRVPHDKKRRVWDVQWRWQCLGRFPNSRGDYSLDGHTGQIHIERKSLADCQGTLLGFDGRRERFESELANLAECEQGWVVVEATRTEVIESAYATPNRTAAQNARTLLTTISAYQMDFKGVQWCFCKNRQDAERTTFWILHRFWESKQRARREVERLVASL